MAGVQKEDQLEQEVYVDEQEVTATCTFKAAACCVSRRDSKVQQFLDLQNEASAECIWQT